MTIFTWRVIALAAAVLFVVCVFVLLFGKFTKNKYYHNFVMDEELRTVKTTNSRNTIYLTSGETKNYIKKYAVCKTPYDKYLVCNFTRPFRRVGFFVMQYSRRKRVVSVLRVTQTATNKSSRVIALKSNCKYVNIVISYADDADINSEVVRPIPVSKLRVYALFKSLAMFTGLFLLRHMIVELLGGGFIQPALNQVFQAMRIPFSLREGMYVEQYFNHTLNYIAIGASLLISLLGFAITVSCFRRKGAKERNGGALEYEFV